MKYRKKTVIIEAERYKPGLEDGFSCIPFVSACRWQNEDGDYKQCMQCKLDIPKKPFISTPEVNLYIDDGDWIITGVDGERYPCKPDIFEMTYDPVGGDIEERDIFTEKDLYVLYDRIDWYNRRKKVVLQVQSHSKDREVLDRAQDIVSKIDTTITEIKCDIDRYDK